MLRQHRNIDNLLGHSKPGNQLNPYRHSKG
jgi:hypothetical protein